MIPVIAAIVAALLGVGVTYSLLSSQNKAREAEAKTAVADAKTSLADAQKKLLEVDSNLAERAHKLQIEAREEVQREMQRLRETIERETADRRNEVKEAERRLRERESQVERRVKNIDSREKAIDARDAESQKRHEEAALLVEKQKSELERVAQLPVAEARDILLHRIEEESRAEMSRVARRIEDEMREEAEARARKVLALTMQRCAVDQTGETSVSVVQLPSDDLKGRIIGREGRNIRTFEQLSGTDLIIDDTPEAVVVSCFEPLRREVARLALTSLVNDGRIHPARIEDMLNKAKLDVQQKMREAADKATTEVHVRLPKPLMDVFGRLLYRTSYGQNMLSHSMEVATFAGILAAEIGANADVARRAGLLHDIGKALDHEHEGTHIELGTELLKKHKENDHVVRAAMEHHNDVANMSCVESVLVQIADAMSSSRPGARRENVETYIKRLQNLEAIADSFDGVEKAFAIQAGREVRIIVRPEVLDDLSSLRLARDVAGRIQDEMTYPGEIKVTVIRETRSVDYAK
ncbi:MAG TPA: ribonuclease Y [Abditibacteriaceae bacterium]|jgi:ribonuclease Y